MKYCLEIEHADNGEIDGVFTGVGSDPEDRRRIAAGLRIIAERVDPDGLNWPAKQLFTH